MPHNGVMKEEISSILDDVPSGIFIDSTYGYGSHFDIILKHNQLTPIGFDRDLEAVHNSDCLLYTSPSPRDGLLSRMPSSA